MDVCLRGAKVIFKLDLTTNFDDPSPPKEKLDVGLHFRSFLKEGHILSNDQGRTPDNHCQIKASKWVHHVHLGEWNPELLINALNNFFQTHMPNLVKNVTTKSNHIPLLYLGFGQTPNESPYNVTVSTQGEIIIEGTLSNGATHHDPGHIVYRFQNSAPSLRFHISLECHSLHLQSMKEIDICIHFGVKRLRLTAMENLCYKGNK
jgi:hypothetical protein